MRVIFIMLFLVAASFCQLVEKKSTPSSDTVLLSKNARPLVYVDAPDSNKNSALTGATASMDSREFSNDSTVGTIIGVGAEFVGGMVKGMLSPNSAETDAVELERQRR